MLLVSLLVLAAEIVVVAAIGVGLSGLIARPLFSVAATYLVVSGLVVGTSAAVANATYHATGVRVRSLPLTPDRFLAAPAEMPGR